MCMPAPVIQASVTGIMERGENSNSNNSIALCKYYYEQEDANDLLPGSSYTSGNSVEKKEEKKQVYYQCCHCLTMYDEFLGEAESGIAAGVSFDALPASYCCPLCESPKTDFVKKEITIIESQSV